MSIRKRHTSLLVDTLAVKNFGPLADVQVSFTPLTVLIGPNDAGKSFLLRALEHIGTGVTEEQGWSKLFTSTEEFRAKTTHAKLTEISFALTGHTFEVDYHYLARLAWEGNLQNKQEFLNSKLYNVSRPNISTITYEVEGATKKRERRTNSINNGLLFRPYFESEFTPSDAPLKPNESAAVVRLIQLSSALSQIRAYRFLPSRLREPVAIAGRSAAQGIDADGFGFPTVLSDVLLRRQDQNEQIQTALRKAVPGIRQLAVRRIGQTLDRWDLELVTADGARVPSPFMSDGVILFAAYLTLAIAMQPLPLLLVEEPETGIHPGLLRELTQLVRWLTTLNRDGQPMAQVIMTTHSPLLLNLLHPDEIRIVRRNEAGETMVSPFDHIRDLERLLEYQGPGEIWVNLGEAELMDKSPAGPVEKTRRSSRRRSRKKQK